MKKVLFLCIVFMLALTLPILADKQGNDDAVFADSKPTEVMVVGECEKVVNADTIQINFFVQHQNENFANGQEYVSNIYSCLCEKLKTIDDDICCDICYMNCKQILRKENAKYNFEQCYCVTSTKLDKIQEIITTAGECGISGYDGVSYSLQNKQEVFDETIQLAIENANNKANNMINNPTLNKIFDNDVFCFECNNQIVVRAFVRALYTSQENQQDTSEPNLINREVVALVNEF